MVLRKYGQDAAVFSHNAINLFRIRHFNTRLNRKSGQQGAAMVFVAGFMIVMAIMTVLAANVGQLVFDKLRLQQTVDQATLGAANIQAIGLNEIADLNRAAREEYQNAKALLSPVPWFNSSLANVEIRYFDEIFYWLDYYRRDANERYAALAVEYANATMAENLPDLYSQGLLEIEPVAGSSIEYLTEYELIPFPVQYSYYTSWCKYCGAPAAFNGPQSPPNFISYDRRQSSRFISVINRTAPVSDVYMPDVRWAKVSPPVTYAAYKITQRRDGYAVGESTLADYYPELRVYASAKPSQGVLFGGVPSYIPLLKHLGRHDPQPAVDHLGEIQH